MKNVLKIKIFIDRMSRKKKYKQCLKYSIIGKILLFTFLSMLILVSTSCMTTTPTKHYYIISYPFTTPSNETLTHFSLRVKDFSISSTYNRNQIVYRYSPHELEYYNYRFWAEKPQKMVSELIRKSITRSSLFSKVTRKLGDYPPDFILTGDIDAIEELDSSDLWFAHLSINLSLERFSDKKVVWSYSFDRKRKVLVKDPRIVVRALSEIMSKEMSLIIDSLRTFLLQKKNHSFQNSENPTSTNLNNSTIKKKINTQSNLKNTVKNKFQNTLASRYFSPHESSWLDSPQLQADITPIPIGKGAVFIPALSSSEREPTAIIYRNKVKIMVTRMGRKIILNSGLYSIKIGSGTLKQMMLCHAIVADRQITIIEPFWAALEIKVVDEHFIPFRGSYELIAIPSREEYGIGFGADEERAEETKVWLLPSGLYKIVQAGGTYRDRTNFATVFNTKSKLTVFTLVLQKDSGDFLGAGIIDEEKGKEIIKKWKLRALLGGDINLMNQTDTSQGNLEGWTYTGNIFLDNYINFRTDPHRLSFRFEIEEGLIKRPDQQAQTLNDRLYFHSIYTYFFNPKFGPYFRAGVETSLMNRYFYLDDKNPERVFIIDADYNKGNLLNDYDSNRIQLGNPFVPIQFIEGAGGNINLLSSEYLSLDLRLGLGYRQYYGHGYLSVQEADDTNVIFKKVEDYSVNGIEASVVAFARLTRYASWSCELDSLFPMNHTDEYLLNLRNVVSFRLVSFASINYKLDLLRDPNINATHPTSLQHQILLRFSYNLF